MARINRTPTSVRAHGDLVVSIESGKPWPGVYRGSKYSLRRNGSDVSLYLNHSRLELEGTVPEGLVEALQDLGKSDGSGLGSFVVTANRDVLTKVHADHYPAVEDAFISDGWIPVYVGKLSGAIEFPFVDNDPDEGTLDPPCVWEGLPFRHGERWTVPVQGGPEWRKQKYSFRFPSTYDHTDLTRTYRSFRPNGGRFRINEHGHVWMELPNKRVQRSTQIAEKVDEWYQEAQERGRNQLLQLIHRRLEATAKDGDPKNGYFPIYIGHISDYDRGDIPTPLINDETYYVREAQVSE